MNLKNKKILVTGGGGFLGKCVIGELIKQGVLLKNISAPSHAECDLMDNKNCRKAVKNQDIVIHLAAKVGGIGFNRKFPGTLFYENLIIGTQLMETARLAGVEKFVAVGTICAYPKFTPVPFKETDLWQGYPEETNAPYGLAKKMLLVQAQAYRRQYGFNAIYLLPVNLYGPGDKFDLKDSHVIPALIIKVLTAKKKNAPFIEVWGTGKATREFLYVGDAAQAIVLATKYYNKDAPVNIGSGNEISIARLVELVCQLAGYRGKIRWDMTQPDGQPRRLLDVSLAKREFGFSAGTDFTAGLMNTISWYEKQI